MNTRLTHTGMFVSVRCIDGYSGFDVGAAWAVWYDAVSAETGRVVTTGGVVDVSTPDFSMPFNVAALTATAHALLFGAVLNILMRRFKKEQSKSN